MAKYMRENDLDLIIANSDLTLVSFTACSGKSNSPQEMANR